MLMLLFPHHEYACKLRYRKKKKKKTKKKHDIPSYFLSFLLLLNSQFNHSILF